MKQRYNVTLEPATRERLLEFGEENHLRGGLSGVIEWLAWNQIKVSNKAIRGQLPITTNKSDSK